MKHVAMNEICEFLSLMILHRLAAMALPPLVASWITVHLCELIELREIFYGNQEDDVGLSMVQRMLQEHAETL